MDDVNPLIENDKTNAVIQNRILRWKSVTVTLFVKFQYQIVLFCSVCFVSLALLVVLSFLFTGVVCPDSWSQFEGHCYFLVTDKYELSTCRAVCQAYGEGADLASIHSPGENQFLADMIQHRPVRNGEKDTWIAGEIKEVNGNFSWLDGTTWDYENWDAGEPDRKIPSYKGNHECVFIGKNLDDPGKWWDGVCEWSRWSFDCLCKI